MNNLRMHSWRQDTADALPGVSAMTHCVCNFAHRRPSPGADYWTLAPDDVILPDAEIERLAGVDLAERCLMLSWDAGRRGWLVQDDRLAESYGRPGLAGPIEHASRRLFQRLHLAGVDPGFIAGDIEEGMSIWPRGGREGIAPLYLAQDVVSTMPEACNTLDKLFPPSGTLARGAISAFNGWAEQIRTRLLRQAVFAPADEAFGRPVDGSNWLGTARAWATADPNGWPLAQGNTAPGNHSNVVLYPTLGQRGDHSWLNPVRRRLALDERIAMSWVDNANATRAMMEWTTLGSAWVSSPDYVLPEGADRDAYRWAWAAQMLHARSVGVNVLLLWESQPWSPEEIAFGRAVLGEVSSMSGVRPRDIDRLPDEKPWEVMAEWIEIAKDRIKVKGN